MPRKSTNLVVAERSAAPAAGADRTVKPVDRAPRAMPSHRSAKAQLRKRALETKDLLVKTAKSLFLEYGYAATTIDNIADAAGVSRASFYTYFSSKVEIMIVAGTDARNDSCDLFKRLGDIDRNDLLAGLEGWIDEYFRFLERDGGYILTWQQAALKDPELRKLGMEGTKLASRTLAESLVAIGAKGEQSDLLVRSLALRSMLDRFWYHWWLTVTPYERPQVLRNLALMVRATILI